MASILIKDTTREERARIVDEAIGNIEGRPDRPRDGRHELRGRALGQVPVQTGCS